ncbi:MAG: ATP-binding protein [Eubacterium sp.]|nr:ATP-binding protein [Eubacterium sp.]
MKHRLVIQKLGPIEQCELECSRFVTLTGFQASGKSTVAKAIYFFRTIKEDIVELIQKQAYHLAPVGGMEDNYDIGFGMFLEEGLKKFLCEKFLQTFGSLQMLSEKMQIQYFYTETCSITISCSKEENMQSPCKLTVVLSNALAAFLQEKNDRFSAAPKGIPEAEMRSLRTQLYQLFADNCAIIYIPAGRTMLTVLSQQLGYIYATMDDFQKRSLDLCTRDYMEQVLRIKPEFSEGLSGLIEYSVRREALPEKVLELALGLIHKILRGTYYCKNGEERIVLDSGNYVKLNFSSSGQQECVWILNLLFYFLLQQKQMLFIIEEPESHLFPASQKYMTELIALVNNCGHSIVLTTHSPYVLGSLNNLLYAHTVQPHSFKEAGRIIPMDFWLDFDEFDAWFVKDGMLDNCMDSEIHMIQNERIDEISTVINQDFDKLLDLQQTEEKGVVESAIKWV